jgi:hypothetical protein
MSYFINGPHDKIFAKKAMMIKNTTTTSDATIISKAILPPAIEEFSPYLRFTYALNAPDSKRQYPKRFKVFLDYLGIDVVGGNNISTTIEERANKLYYDYIIKKGNKWLETELCKFFMLQNERAERCAMDDDDNSTKNK